MAGRFRVVGRLLEAGAGHLAAASAAYREQCRQAGVQARALAAFAAQRPKAVLDRPGQEVGTAAARAEVEARLLARAEAKTVGQLKAAARREVLRADAAAARRLAAAIRERGVRAYPGADGMASLAATLATPVAAARRRALEAYAADCRIPGDARTREQRMANCLIDLILRPGINWPVRIGLTVVAAVDTLTGGEEPGEVDGQPSGSPPTPGRPVTGPRDTGTHQTAHHPRIPPPLAPPPPSSADDDPPPF